MFFNMKKINLKYAENYLLLNFCLKLQVFFTIQSDINF